MRGVLLDPATGRPQEPGSARRYTSITDIDVTRDVNTLAGREAQSWDAINRELREGGDPLALQGGIAGLEYPPPPDALAAITLSAAEQALWAAGTYCPIAANSRSPVEYELFASGTITTTATASPTILFTPRFGVVVGGGTLGATPSIVLTASQAAVPWQIRGDVTVRGTGSGTNARVKGTFTLIGKFVTPANGIIDAHHIFGYTAATGDSSIAQGLWMGIISTITTPTITVEQIRWGSWN
jgi:hypothetical protein